MNFETIFLNALYLLGIMFILSLIWVVLASIYDQIEIKKIQRSKLKELLSEMNKEMLRKMNNINNNND